MQKSKKISIVLGVIVVLGGIYLLWSRSGSSLKQNENQNVNQSGTSKGLDQSTVADKSSSNVADNLSADENINQNTDQESPEGKRSNEQANEGLRQEIIAYINKNLDKLVSPPAKDKWDVPTYYFIGNSVVYVELYAVDTDLAGVKLLYQVKKGANGIELSELARYKEGEEDWILNSGQDNYDNYVMEEYDFNDENQKWEKTDEFTDETNNDNSGADNSNTNSPSIMP